MDDATPTAAAASHSIRGRFHFRRNSNPSPGPDRHSRDGGAKSLPPSDRQLLRASRAHHGRANRKGLGLGLGLSSLVPPFRGKSLLYLAILLAVFVFAMASMVLQSSITSVFKQGGARRGSAREGLKFGSTLKFVPSRQLAEGGRLDRARSERRIGVRPPRLALVLGNLRKDPQFLMLFSVVSNLKKLGYTFQIYAVEYGKALPVWKDVASQISVLGPEQYGHIDWSIYEGIIVDSIEAKEAVSSLMQEPFSSVPLVWVIQDDVLAKRIPFYEEMDWKHLVTLWRNTFSRADVIVFPDFTLPMLYSVLDTGNFFVIPGSPVDVWSAERYSQTHFKHQLRELNGFQQDDLVVLVIGSSLFYNELSWDYAVAMHAIGPLLVKYARRSDGGSYKFVFLCGNSTGDSDDAFQEIASRLGLLQGSVRHFGINADVDSVLTMADIVLYGSSQDEQGFPPLLVRSMTFGIPIVVPDIPVITKYVVDGVHGILFPQHNPDALMRAFSSLIADGRLSEFAITVASSGKLLAKNMMASECISTYVKLLENILDFPSDAILPGPVAKLEELSWNWNLLEGEINQDAVDMPHEDLTQAGVVYALEEELTDLVDLRNASENQTDTIGDFPTEEDWAVLQEIEQIEEFEKVEKEELEERMERDPGSWNDIYRNARKSEKLSFEANERDEGELERTGQPVCIYEIYEGAGAWSFLHHGSLYRGLSLSTKARRLRSDDVDAVSRLRLLNNTYYQDILCEMGGMFSIAKRVDNIHSRPWIGFQSWRTAGRKVSLSPKAEKVLEESVQGEEKGDVIYFWARLDMDGGVSGSNDVLTFWSMCDILNGGGCRNAFEQAFRKIYALPSHIEALPPMPEDGGYWSTLHSWVMPTPSFLEFIMFTRMFADSLDSLHINSSATNFCLLGETEAEKKHCYCRILELLVNVWAYHSARKMVYLDPHTGSLSEQHPVELRRGYMWAKYFNFTLLKSMDEDLAEAADDGDNPREPWLWPLSGEVHWQGIYEREREERYRLKMDKKRKTREKLNERMKHGYKQKSLGG